VVDAMREALSAEFKAAVLTYDERPRTKWLTENSVQNTLTVSRLMFTADINAAFDEMEEGNIGALKACSHACHVLTKPF
jgi:dynein heavy chain